MDDKQVFIEFDETFLKFKVDTKGMSHPCFIIKIWSINGYIYKSLRLKTFKPQIKKLQHFFNSIEFLEED